MDQQLLLIILFVWLTWSAIGIGWTLKNIGRKGPRTKMETFIDVVLIYPAVPLMYFIIFLLMIFGRFK